MDGEGQPVPPAAAEAIIAAGRRMDARGWVPATAGNISIRVTAGRIAITRSGCHKGHLTPGDVMQVDALGDPLPPVAKPSAETGLHCQIYRLFPTAGAVLHGHSVAGTVLSMALLPGQPIRFAGYEVIKAFEGQATHEAAVDLPVFDNDQDIPRLARAVEPVLESGGAPIGYLIRGHGVYVWGRSMDAALTRLEALEFLLACELERRRLAP
ncbi:MAG TPA: methylthioribulose 1-phosphate dehydratase [Acetobacteraceae bacterium]|nr:methylthioribulose 1-phosphate dehydratase [Acetobacteraceae bacterium]